ncbi:MAG: hypothetical protein NTY53_21885 [Kiritimatiellaeota bacterium]|nr:hypothetical protein [Kiritimatiellota bacterium]
MEFLCLSTFNSPLLPADYQAIFGFTVSPVTVTGSRQTWSPVLLVKYRAGSRKVAARCQTDVPALREIEPGHCSACHFAEEL